MSINRPTDKQNVLYTSVEYYSALRRKEVLTHATVWVDLEDIMLSEVSRSPKDMSQDSTYVMYLEQWHSQMKGRRAAVGAEGRRAQGVTV